MIPLSLAVVALGLCVLGFLIALHWFAARLSRTERAHRRLVARVARSENLARERSRRIRGRVYILERQRSDRFRSVFQAMAAGLIRLPTSGPVAAGDAVAQNEDGTVRMAGAG